MEHIASVPQPSSVEQAADRRMPEEVSQEQLLKAKYGGLIPKKKLVPRDQKYFDSADWQMSKQQGEGPPGLRPKLRPSQPPPRRNSQLGESR